MLWIKTYGSLCRFWSGYFIFPSIFWRPTSVWTKEVEKDGANGGKIRTEETCRVTVLKPQYLRD